MPEIISEKLAGQDMGAAETASGAGTGSSPTSTLPVRKSPPRIREKREVNRRIFVPDDKAQRGMYEETSSSSLLETPPRKRASSVPARSRDLPRRILLPGDDETPSTTKKRPASTGHGTVLKRRKLERQLLKIEQPSSLAVEVDGASSAASAGAAEGETVTAQRLDLDSPTCSQQEGGGQGGSSPREFHHQEQAESPGSGDQARLVVCGSPDFFRREPIRERSPSPVQLPECSTVFAEADNPDSPRTPPGRSAAAIPTTPKAPRPKRDRRFESLSTSTRGTNRRLNFD